MNNKFWNFAFLHFCIITNTRRVYIVVSEMWHPSIFIGVLMNSTSLCFSFHDAHRTMSNTCYNTSSQVQIPELWRKIFFYLHSSDVWRDVCICIEKLWNLKLKLTFFSAICKNFQFWNSQLQSKLFLWNYNCLSSVRQQFREFYLK